MNRFFILPFDHRSTFAKLLGFEYPPKNAAQKKKIKDMKQIVFDAFLFAHNIYDHSEEMGILVDEEFGTSIINQAQKQIIPFAMTVEKSGHLFFQFEHGNRFGAYLKKWKPSYAKVLVRYNAAEKQGNKIQIQRLKRLNDFCEKNDMKWMFELLVSGKGSQFNQMKKSIKEIRKSGIDPNMWKLEGLPYPKYWKQINKIAKRDIIVLGRGESKVGVEKWIIAAAKSGVVNGFAIGRTIFFKPLEQYLDKKITRKQAVEKIAKNYLHFIKLWDKYQK